jgi:prenylcysteine alpha-carboxyl methylesterase
MEGEELLPRFSPEIVAKKSSAEAIALLPQIILLHGTKDHSIPSSARFDSIALRKLAITAFHVL